MTNAAPRDAEEIAHTWISYHAWRASRPIPENRTPQELREDDAEAERNGFWASEAVDSMIRERPEDAWLMTLRLVELAPDDHVLANVAAGPLEHLLSHQPYVFVDRVEHSARNDAKFRRCVSGVWGWSSIPEDVQARLRATWEGEEPL